MQRLRTHRSLAIVAVSVTAALGIAACGGDEDDTGQPAATMAAATMAEPTSAMDEMMTAAAESSMAESDTMMDHSSMAESVAGDETMAAAGAPTSATAAAGLRAQLNLLLEEHVYLASMATNAALAGRTPEFDGAAAALDANGVALGDLIGSAYGDDAKEGFLGPWRQHIGFVVDYTTGVATNDQAMQDKAVADLGAYATSFGAVLNGLNENLPRETVAELLGAHIQTLAAVVDAQAAGDAPGAFTAVREAAAHMSMLGDPLASATVAKFPDAIEGDPDSPAAGLRSQVDMLLAEHVYLASIATNEALKGNTPVFEAAAAALDQNGVDIADLLATAYGPEVREGFLGPWRQHIGFVVDYTTGVATDDQAMQDKAVADLGAYATSFGAVLNGVNENLPREAVGELLGSHIMSLKDVIDAQAAGDDAAAFLAIRTAAGHMPMIGDAIAEATVQKYPDAFAG